MGGQRIALLALVIGALVLVGYAVALRTSSRAPVSALHLPSLGRVDLLDEAPGPCAASAYPPGAEYTFERCTSSTKPVTWGRCSRVTYAVDPGNAPTEYSVDVQQAIQDLEVATGLTVVPVRTSADITISWDPSLYDPTPGTSGEAGVTDFKTSSGISGAHVVSASIQLSSHLTAGGAPGMGEKPVLLHELGHAVGLGHYSGPVVMNPMDRGLDSYQPGDLAGLAALYHPQSCR